MGLCDCLNTRMELQVFLLFMLSLTQVAIGQPIEQCCTRKTVGGIEYSLINETDTSGYNCKTNCVYEKDEAPGSRYCFASGDLPVDCGDGGNSNRQIICNYLPKSDVMEHWKIDLDQKDLETFLETEDFVKAKGVYENGANSMKTSDITLDTALTQGFAAGSVVTQGSKKGVLNKPASAGDQIIKVGIDPPCISDFGASPDTSGCFSDTGGSFIIDGTDVGAGTVNLKYRTLAGFSTAADSKMTGYEMFEKYKAYYGVGDYAHRFIMAALDAGNEVGTSVNMDFSAKDEDFRVQSAMTGSAFWSNWMYLIWEMEDAIGDCVAGCSGICNDAPVHAWDEAWAFYTGSLEGKFGNAAGIFPYRLAENMCMIMDTCLAGKSKVNRELENAFIDGKNMIDQGNCDGAKAFKSTIMTKMSIPLVQATFNSAYSILDGDTSSQAKAKVAAFAGSILPQVANCSTADADTIKSKLWIDSPALSTAGFTNVKKAFEDNYACMGITCDDIGGMAGVSGFEKC